LPQASPGGIDRRAVGPFLLPNDERAYLQAAALSKVACLHRRLDMTATVVDSPTGAGSQTSVPDLSSTSWGGLWIPTLCRISAA